MASCEICGDELRRFCSQGHASRAGALFCGTCGEMLPLAGGVPVMAAAAPLTMDYSSGSFADFIAGGDEAVPGPGLPSTRVAPGGPITEPDRVLEPAAAPEMGPAAPPAPDAAPVAPKPAPPPGSKAPATEPKPAPPPSNAVPPPAANGGTTTTMPPDLRFTAPPDAPRTWRSSTKPRDKLGPDGGVHHDDGPPLAEESGPAAEPRPGRSRRFRVIAIVVVVAVLAAGVIVGAVALHRHYAAKLTAPSSPPVARASTTPSAVRTSAAPSSPAQPVQLPGWAAPIPVQTDDGAVITGISCPTISACYAADSSGPVLSSKPPAGWHRVATDSAARLVAISCATATRCVALDNAGDAFGLKNGVWSSPALVDIGTGAFTGLSCPTVTFCMASDSSGVAYAET